MAEENTLYSLLHGEVNIKKISSLFYSKMDSDLRFKGIRSLHARSLHQSEQKLFEFLSGWLGGPPLYSQKYGHPRLRARHLLFSIGKNERDQWLTCMKETIIELDFNSKLEPKAYLALIASFEKTADFMRNKDV